ncbi:hypothetical protein BTVI_21861 [Pitangus sulphuratus]|nr:hypothetical protein BTVI_21861 [Pitangus sulphuratus]
MQQDLSVPLLEPEERMKNVAVLERLKTYDVFSQKNGGRLPYFKSGIDILEVSDCLEEPNCDSLKPNKCKATNLRNRTIYVRHTNYYDEGKAKEIKSHKKIHDYLEIMPSGRYVYEIEAFLDHNKSEGGSQENQVPNHPLGEESSSNIQLKPPLTQIHTTPLGPVTGHLREEISACPTSSPHKEVVDCNEVSPQSPLLQDEQTK